MSRIIRYGRATCPSSAGFLADRLPDFFDSERPHIQKREDAAGAGLAALELPRERADDAACVQHALDVATHVLGVDAAFGEGSPFTPVRPLI